MSYIGERVPRIEDVDLVTGAGRYVADIAVPGCVEAAFVRSDEAHGYLRSVDVSEARTLAGVLGAWSAQDLADLPPVPNPPAVSFPAAMDRPALARDRVRFVGDPVAVVLAEDPGRAEDAAEMVAIEVKPLPTVLDPTEAARDAVTLFEGASNVAYESWVGEGAEEALREATIRVELTLRNQRVAPASIEPRAILVLPEDGNRLTVWCSHQAPHRLRMALARALGLPPADVRVIAPQVGGAFGAKQQTAPEYLVTAYLALQLGTPVRWLERRSEAFVAATHGRGQNQRLHLGTDRRGRILVLAVEIDADVGAYPQTGCLVPTYTAWVMSGPYQIPNLSVHIRAVVTNAPPTGSYRGAGRPEATFALERLMDVLARRLDLDPVEVRYRNFIPPERFPYQSPTGALYDSGRYAAALELAVESGAYRDLREEQRRRRAEGRGPLLGIGVASYLERSGAQSAAGEFGAVEVCKDGSVEAMTGASSQGQGHRTSLAQVVATALDLPLERVRVVEGDTDRVPEGTGTMASQSLQVGGGALHVASDRVLSEARQRASDILEAAAEDLRYGHGAFRVAGSPDRFVRIEDIVAKTGRLGAEERFPSTHAFPFGSYVAVVEIDRDTGAVRVVKLVLVDDVGVVVNPAIVQGQTVGSAVQGLGQALYEGIGFDDRGQPVAASLLDYGIPTPAELPEIVLRETVTPNPNNPLGAKGAGEAGCIGVPPAVVNAIVDALQGFDVSGIDMPVTPEKVWRAMHGSAR